MGSEPSGVACDSRVNHVKTCHNIPQRKGVKSLKRAACLLKELDSEHVRIASGAEEQPHDIGHVAALFKVLCGEKTRDEKWRRG